jgi:hypothetical protein
MDTAIIATLATGLLSPFLSYLLKGGEKAVEQIGSKIGTEAWERAKGIWSKLSPKINEQPAVLKAAESVAKAPTDEKAQNNLSARLKELLDTDEALARQVGSIALYDFSANATASGDGSSAFTGRDIASQAINDSTLIITGHNNIVGHHNYTAVTKGNDNSNNATPEELSSLLSHLRKDLSTANVDDKTRKFVNTDLQAVEDEVMDPRPSLPIIETRLNAIQSMVKSVAHADSPTEAETMIQKAIELSRRLFS